MHLVRLFIDPADLDGGRKHLRGELNFASGTRAIRKWTVLPAEETPLQQLHYIMLACATRHDLSALRPLFPSGTSGPGGPVTVEAVQVRHAPQDCGRVQPTRRVGGWMIPRAGDITPLEKARSWQKDVRFGVPPVGSSYAGFLLLAYGSRIHADPGVGCLEFSLQYRRKRMTSLLKEPGLLTNPVAFLERLHFRGLVAGRPRSRSFLGRLNRELAPLFGIAPECWLSRRHDFRRDWECLPERHRTRVIVLLDAARHVLEASVKLYDPWPQPGVMVMDSPERWCFPAELASYLRLLDRLFPRLQFILRLGAAGRRCFPRSLRTETLAIPEPQPRPPRVKPRAVPRGTVLLVDVDGAMPNLALMKLSRHLKDQGKRVALSRVHSAMPEVDSVFASSVFSNPGSVRRVTALRERYGARVELGGSGISLQTRLPHEIEELDADLSLYPELGDRAIGFLTRGCPRRCPFCVVPLKEGKPRLVSDLKSLLQGHRKLILLDDNLLAHPQAEALLEEMAQLGLAVNFNQTLDLRLLTARSASLLSRIRCSNVSFTRRCYHFSLNDARGLNTVRERLNLLPLSRQDNVEFICMYGFRTTLGEDLARFRFLRSLPRTYVFVQRYQAPPAGLEPDLEHFFDEHADKNLDALVKIVFPQNMKSMEVYYRWVCLLYARQRGRIHSGLVETLFRYNYRHRQGSFVTKLQAICAARDSGAASVLLSENEN
jgi:hypothetical protein